MKYVDCKGLQLSAFSLGTVQLTDYQLDTLHAAFHNIAPCVINPGAWYNHT